MSFQSTIKCPDHDKLAEHSKSIRLQRIECNVDEAKEVGECILSGFEFTEP